MYKIKLPYRWRIDKYTKEYETQYVPIVDYSNNNLFFNGAFYGDMIDAKTDNAKKALIKFEKMLYKTMIKETIKPGEVVCIDNRVMFHARSKFEAKFDNIGRGYRWIQRIFVTDNLDNLESLVKVNDRIFAPIIK